MADGYEFSVKFLTPEGLRFSIRQGADGVSGTYRARGPHAGWTQRGPGGARVAAGTVIEAALPLADLALAGAATVSFFIAAYDASGAEIERHPAHRPMTTAVPDERFEARNWSA